MNIAENPLRNRAAWNYNLTVGDSPKLGRQLIGRSGVS